jgi:anaerobic selenocysteine-containing dehydrogenase
VFQVSDRTYSRAHERPLASEELDGTSRDEAGDTVVRNGAAVGAVVDGTARAGFNTPSRRLEFYSPTLAAWGWPEHAVPRYVPGHVHWRELDRQAGEFDLLPNFRLPTLIHTRSPVKWLYEISHDNPLWIAAEDARARGIATGDLVKVHTRIGYFVTRAWVTEGIRPGVLAMSHHLGRWRLHEEQGGARVASSLVSITRDGAGRYTMKQVHGARPFESSDPDTSRVWWSEVGVHQNLTFPVQPDPVSGMHCWHQRVRLDRAGPEDAYGDVMVDTERAHAVYREWLQKARPAPGPGGVRRPAWFDRPLRPVPDAYKLPR